MTPLYSGRLETRLFLLGVIGGLWTAVVTPFLPGGGSLATRYQATFSVLAVVFVLGAVWDVLYQFLQQFRWEKDWPIMFTLLTGFNEGIAVWAVFAAHLVPGHPVLTGAAFIVHFTTVWLLTWLFAIGPMRVVFPRWRFQGGRLR